MSVPSFQRKDKEGSGVSEGMIIIIIIIIILMITCKVILFGKEICRRVGVWVGCLEGCPLGLWEGCPVGFVGNDDGWLVFREGVDEEGLRR